MKKYEEAELEVMLFENNNISLQAVVVLCIPVLKFVLPFVGEIVVLPILVQPFVGGMAHKPAMWSSIEIKIPLL